MTTRIPPDPSQPYVPRTRIVGVGAQPSLQALTDVAPGTPTDDQVLAWDAASGLWIPQTLHVPQADTDLGSDRTSTSTSYETLTGAPAVSLTTGTEALVSFGALSKNSSGNAIIMVGFVISGATTLAAAENTSIIRQDGGTNVRSRKGMTTLVTGLTAGVNVFTMQVKQSAGTTTFTDMELIVTPL